MIVWGLGLPLLFWHRWRGITRGYLVYSASFILISVVSHFVFGECFLTTLARQAYEAGHHPALREKVSFIVRMTELIAGIRPSERWAVWVWQVGLFTSSTGMLWYFHRERVRSRRRGVCGSGASQLS